MTPNKVCPVVLRGFGENQEILAFEHPLAGCQLIKGSIDDHESVGAAALRELAEESGIRATINRELGLWTSGYNGQVWAFVQCTPIEDLPQTWVHHASDDGGHDFRFFWHRLFKPAGEEGWHTVFRDALAFVRAATST